MVTIEQVLARVTKPTVEVLPPPVYSPPGRDPVDDRYGEPRPHLALAVASMKDHTTDEGWQVMLGLEESNYELAGYELDTYDAGGHSYSSLTDVAQILQLIRPQTVMVQDKREWDVPQGNFRDPRARFTNVESLAARDDIFKLTILKDAQQRPDYHRQSAQEMGVHAWIVYYHPRIVAHVAPYVRPQHLIRTYHTVDGKVVPPFDEYPRREGCLLSGAVSNVYPLRQRLIQAYRSLHATDYLQHPGYHRRGCCTPEFLHTLSRYRVAICTASVYGYSLRKIIEATACGCRVLTDLPVDDVLPGGIDGNLVRVDSTATPQEVNLLLVEMCASYDPYQQHTYAERARMYYDYRSEGLRLAQAIQHMKDSLRSPQEESYHA